MKKVEIKLYPNAQTTEISPLIYGHFAEHVGGVIYDGIWVGRDSKTENINGIRAALVEKLKRLSPPVIRWPGGCFVEAYDWRDGIGENRPTKTSYWTSWDGSYETNEFGLHEFVSFCRLVGAEPYIAINVTSATALDAKDLIDYCNSPRGSTTLAGLREKNGSPEPFGIKYFGIGNENWGGGGTMAAEQYAYEYRRFSSIVRSCAKEAKLVAGAANFHSDEWARIFFDGLKEEYGTPPAVDGASFHYYFSGEGDVGFSEDEWDKTVKSALALEEQLTRLEKIIEDSSLSQKIRIYVDEWGAMYSPTHEAKAKNQLFRQQVTMRDAITSALALNIFNNHAKTVEMANVAQLTNCLSSLFLTDGEKCITTPNYHVFDMYREHGGASLIKSVCPDGQISVSASVKNGSVLVTLANLSAREDKLISLGGDLAKQYAEAKITLLCSDSINDANSPENPDFISPKCSRCDATAEIKLPRASVVSVQFVPEASGE